MVGGNGNVAAGTSTNGARHKVPGYQSVLFILTRIGCHVEAD